MASIDTDVEQQSSAQPATRKHTTARATLFGIMAVFVITAVLALVNWHWLAANVVTYGWDRLDHLITSLVYSDTLNTLTPRALFAVLAYSDYYPPLVHLTAVGLYRLFGVSEDVAVMANVLYLGLLLGATWSITRRISADWVALLATIFLATFPLIFAMSRYLYLDLALTSMVAVATALVLATERFRRRWTTLLFGLALGLAFLIKWTTAAFLLGPLLFIVWRSKIIPTLVRQPTLLRPDLRKLLAAVAIAAGLNLLWLYPAWDLVTQQMLGVGLYVVLTLLVAGVLYALFPTGPRLDEDARTVTYALGGAAVAAWVIGLWYLTNAEFVNYFLFTAYGREEPFYAFEKYVREVVGEQLGPLYALMFLLVVGVWFWQQRHDFRRRLAGLSDTAWVLLLWVVVPYFIFSWRVTLAHSRFIMPFLPPFAIWLAAGMAQWRPRWLRITVIAAVLTLALAQYALISFDELATWRPRMVVNTPGGPINLLASGFFIQYPTSGRTDPGYAVAPEVLSVVDEARKAAGKDVIHLGLLVNSYQIHEKHFLYQIYRYFPQVRLRELARNWNDQAAYNQLFEMDYVLVSDTHTFRTNENSQVAAYRILNDSEDMFNRAFRPVQQWILPSGEQLTLYTRRFEPTEPGVATEDILALLALFDDQLGPGDAVVLTAPDLVYSLGLALPAGAGATIVPLPAENQSPEEARATLDALRQSQGRIFFVRHNTDQADPAGVIEGWFQANTTAANDLWANSLRVTPFVPLADSGRRTLAESSDWDDGVKLVRAVQYQSSATALPVDGGALPVGLKWEIPDEQPRKVSLQLLTDDGTLIAQEDRDLSSEEQTFVLLIPRSILPGDYLLSLALYDPSTLERVPLTDGAMQMPLGQIQIGANPAPAKVYELPDSLPTTDPLEDEGA